MRNKIFLQLFLIIVVIAINYFLYVKYFKDNEPEIYPKNENPGLDNEENQIKNIEYESTDNLGRKYLIKAERGKIDIENSNVIYMFKVLAKIILIDNSTITITADRAIYDNITYNTNFENDVAMIYEEHSVNSENLDLLFQENILEAYNDLIYKNADFFLTADKIEINMETKNSKIYNFNEKKVLIRKLDYTMGIIKNLELNHLKKLSNYQASENITLF